MGCLSICQSTGGPRPDCTEPTMDQLQPWAENKPPTDLGSGRRGRRFNILSPLTTAQFGPTTGRIFEHAIAFVLNSAPGEG